MLSACSTPSKIQRISGTIAAVPAQAASTCSQIPSDWQIAAIAGTGSMAVEDVVPTVATTHAGISPLARSSAIASSQRRGAHREDLVGRNRPDPLGLKPAIRRPLRHR